MIITIYGASDDLVEIEGDIREEFYLGREGTRLSLVDPDGETLDVFLDFGRRGSLDWTISVEAMNGYPSWPIMFHERPDYAGDPAVTIEAPEGTEVRLR